MAALHPQLVHFTVVLIVVGVAFRLLSLFGRTAWVGPAAAAGVGAVFFVYQTAKYGGDLVYNYAGGVGIRSGDPQDVERLLLAGYYHQAQADRAAGRPQQAARLIAQAVERFPDHLEVKLLAAESALLDRKDAQASIDALTAVQIPDNSRPPRTRKVTLLADAYEAAGRRTDAITALEALLKTFPNPRLQARVDALKK